MYISDSVCTQLANQLYTYWNTNLFMFSTTSASYFEEYGEYEALKVLEKFKRKVENPHITRFSQTYSSKDVYPHLEDENIPPTCLINFETLLEFIYSTDPDDDKYEYDTPHLVKTYVRVHALKTLEQVIEDAHLTSYMKENRLEIRMLPIDDDAFRREKELAVTQFFE